MDPIYEFISHIKGRNARVRIYPDRIEWAMFESKMKRRMDTIVTFGVAAFWGKNEETFNLPIKQVSSVRVTREKISRNSTVILATSTGDMEMRVSHEEAEVVKRAVLAALTA